MTESSVPTEDLTPKDREDFIAFEVKMGQSVVFGGVEGLPRRLLELSLNEQGNLRVIRLEGENTITVWGQDKKQNSAWVNWHFVEALPNKVYERIDGGKVIIDIETSSRAQPDKLVRLSEAARTPDSRIFRIEENPAIRDLRITYL